MPFRCVAVGARQSPVGIGDLRKLGAALRVAPFSCPDAPEIHLCDRARHRLAYCVHGGYSGGAADSATGAAAAASDRDLVPTRGLGGVPRASSFSASSQFCTELRCQNFRPPITRSGAGKPRSRVHRHRHISLMFPRSRLTVFASRSGSGSPLVGSCPPAATAARECVI